MSNVYGELCARGTVSGNSLATLGEAKMMYPIRTRRNSGDLLGFELEDLSPKNRSFEESEKNPNKRGRFALDRLVAASPAEYMNIQRSLLGNSTIDKERLFRVEKCFEYMESAGNATATGNGTAEAVPAEPKSLVVFFGGGADSSINKNVHDKLYLEFLKQNKDSLYFAHDGCDEAVRAIIKAVMESPETVITLVGHSWGADTAIDEVANSLNKVGLDVALVITLDGVTTLPSKPEVKPSNVAEWINVWVDTSKPGCGNRWANALNGHWGKRDSASSNIFVPQANHCDTREMFSQVSSRVLSISKTARADEAGRKMQLDSFKRLIDNSDNPSNFPEPGRRRGTAKRLCN